MGDLVLRGDWESHIVLACITCEKVILLSRNDKDRKAARVPLQKIINLLPFDLIDLDHRKNGDKINNLFLPTVCASCSKLSSWTSLSINRRYIETWQPYLAMGAFLEGDMSLLGSSISMVHYEKLKDAVGAAYVLRSVKVNPTPEAAAKVEPYLQSGFL